RSGCTVPMWALASRRPAARDPFLRRRQKHEDQGNGEESRMALGSRRMTTTAPSKGAVTIHDRLAEREQQLARRRRMIEAIQGQGLLLVFVVVFVIMWTSSPYFFTINNLA